MLNKKLLAASIAATLSTSAFAAIDLNAEDGYDKVLYSSELAATATSKGMFTVTDTNVGTVLDVQTETGFVFPQNANRYVRIDLANATFGATPPDLSLDTSPTATVAISAPQAGGGEGDNYVIFRVSSDEDVSQKDTFTLSMDNMMVSSSEEAAITYRLYEELTPAASQGDALYTDEGNVIIGTASGIDGDVVKAATAPEATVASDFENFGFEDDGTTVIDTASLGTVNFAGSLDSDVLALDSTELSEEDLYDANYTATLTGDVSFGTFFLSPGADCTTGTAVALTATSEAATSAATAEDAVDPTTEYTVCVTVANDTTDELVIKKGDYTLKLTGDSDDVVEGDLASIEYDTVAVEVPYITTFEDYRQRIYMVNRSSNDVYYTTTFRTEGVARATAGDKAEGTIPAGEMIAVRASDMVTLVGRTRTAATIELEAIEGQVDISTQTVNLSNGTTDTVKLTD